MPENSFDPTERDHRELIMETKGNSFSNGHSYGGGPDIPKLYRQGQ